ncbi:hypothetical protein SI65_05956 [Aspergillus cristatus]|uniref:DUF676 domain-containing protein n=1 Tax=Aspergillus cristatus TaxID=573508 RepID=A0A1E3BEL5_ASPCR|nr:hypothetical protein SI65_05956 [Aspergillus cristatus]
MCLPFSFAKREHIPEQMQVTPTTEEDRQGKEERQPLTTVYNGENPVVEYQTSYPSSVILVPVANQASARIVAVHGLNGDAFGSFTSTINGKFWLADEDMLPRHIPNCRVLTFSYPALTSSPREAIKQHAKTLVKELAEHRRMEDATERPILFICHSVGGIIVKQALIDSKYQATDYDLRSIHILTSGLVFFGTPHNGCNKANLASFLRQEAETYGKAVYTDLQQLDSLETRSAFL